MLAKTNFVVCTELCVSSPQVHLYGKFPAHLASISSELYICARIGFHFLRKSTRFLRKSSRFLRKSFLSSRKNSLFVRKSSLFLWKSLISAEDLFSLYLYGTKRMFCGTSVSLTDPGIYITSSS